jgi:hypothetical protein
MVELPTVITAVLRNPVDTIVARSTVSPALAGTQLADPLGCNSTVPVTSLITAFCAKTIIAANKKTNKISILFIFDLLL